MRKILNKKSQKGQSMIESVVGITIVVVIIVALVAAVTNSIKNATYSKNKSLATKYVNQGIEAVRSIRDRSWTELTAGVGTSGLSYTGNNWVFSGLSDNPDNNNVFTRTVAISCPDPNACNVIVEVSWKLGAQTLSSKSTTSFTKWK